MGLNNLTKRYLLKYKSKPSNKNKVRTDSLAIPVLLFAFVLLLPSCQNDEPLPILGEFENAIFIVNEGNFTAGNSSLTYFNHKSGEVQQQIFYRKNNAPLGDVANSISFDETSIYLVVNNSHLVYKINSKTGIYEAKTIELTSPRHFLKIDEDRALISDLYEKNLTMVNTKNMEIISKIPIGRTSENMLKLGDEVFIANWSGYNQNLENNMVLVLDLESLKITDSIEVGLEPNSIVLDKDNFIWVLCSGGFLNEEKPSLWKINPSTKVVHQRFLFEDITSTPTKLSINPDGNLLYFINKDVFQMDISLTELSAIPFVLSTEINNFYSLGIGFDSDIYISDANDYTRNGTVYRYSQLGILKQEFEAGIIPGAIGFME